MPLDPQPFIAFIQSLVPMPDARAREVVAGFEEVMLPKGALLLQEGSAEKCYLFLQEGIMRSYTHTPEGDEVTTDLFTAGRVVFEVASFFTHRRAGESLQAVTDCRGFGISFDRLNSLFHSLSEFREFGRAVLVREFAGYKARTLSRINQPAEARYADLMAREGALLQHVPLKHIASYLGITDSSLSRIRREFAHR